MQDRRLCCPPYFFLGPAVPPPHFFNSRIATGVTRGAERGAIPRVPNHYRGAKSQRRAPESRNNVATTFFNTVYLLPNDLKVEHGGANLVFCPGRHLTLLRPCPFEISKRFEGYNWTSACRQKISQNLFIHQANQKYCLHTANHAHFAEHNSFIDIKCNNQVANVAHRFQIAFILTR